jgi:DNA-binding PadR family transcriptional regulator
MPQMEETLKYLPLSEATYYIMLALVKPRHGYAVMQMVERLSEETVQIGAGTLYGAMATLEKEALIVKIKEEGRRKYYALTPRGKAVLASQIRRLEVMARQGLGTLDRLWENANEHGPI